MDNTIANKNMNKFHGKFHETGGRIKKAFVRILDRRDYEDISVTSLCKEAQINRSTFYLHYSNIEEIAREIEDELNECKFEADDQYLAKLLRADPNERRVREDEMINNFLNSIREHQDAFYAAAKNPKLFGQEKRLKEEQDLIYQNFCHVFGRADRTIALAASYTCAGIHDVLYSWILGGCIESNDVIRDVFHICFNLKTYAVVNEKSAKLI
ncbi:MAG: TetR/AcrR family transcriptional regulator [Lachnospiraceae bacterium]|jgi:AcrR family transcriptional regulator|nr:TetR/AcrR family transcriptional regulator [Lachnospiraceae bacterium]MDD5849233.1 TetR family transcriptional regulator [Bacillota bacterium]